MHSDAGVRPRFGLNNFQLKSIALTAMVIDHTGVIFSGYNGADLTLLRLIGRVAFPVFAFLIAEGCRHTRDMKKYMLRLFVFALMSQLFFFTGRVVFGRLAPEAQNPFTALPSYNVFFTLLLGAVSVYCYERLKDAARFAAFLPFCAAMALAYYLNTDYDAVGVFMIFAAYIAQNRRWQLIAMLSGILLLYYQFLLLPVGDLRFFMPCAAGLSLFLIALYNGGRGKPYKWIFYIAYPGHFAALGLLYFLFIT
ncbi:MAG: conjugal transfer protein TraX [Clostridiales bacterium]|jgi:hypothetical protein|nr:conjugal transfer protein TraX [Clostridiales bacterium]